ALDDKASYPSPLLLGRGKVGTAVFLTQKGLVGLDAGDGQLRFEFPFEDKLAESSTTPVRVGDNLLISSITLGSALVSLEGTGGKAKVTKVTKLTQLWMDTNLTCYFSTPVAMNDQLIYLVTGSLLGGQATLHCVDAKKGTSLWQKAGVGKYHATLMRTGNGKVLMVEEAGNLVLLEPNAQKYEELCRSKICGNTWAHPAVSDERLYIRDQKELVCVQLP